MEPAEVLLIDDEYANTGLMSLLIERTCKDLKVCGTANSILEAIPIIDKKRPKVVFLDIEMPEANGFKLFDYYPEPDFLVVFITAYSHYAIKAIQMHAFDYLVKPVGRDELLQVEQKIIKEIRYRKARLERQEFYFNKIEQLVTEVEQLRKNQQIRIQVPTGGGFRMVDITNIQFAEAAGNYANLVLGDGSNMLITKSLGDLEDLLKKHHFFRCHKSYLLNLSHLKSFSQKDGGMCTTTSGKMVPVSRRKYSEFIGIVKDFGGQSANID